MSEGIPLDPRLRGDDKIVIGIFDSGHGGLTIEKALRERLPAQRFLYFGDHANAPYGLRPAEEIIELTRAGLSKLFDAGCRLVVIACNSAAAVALRHLQQNWLADAYPGHRALGVVVPMVEAITEVPWSMADRIAHDPTLVGIFGTSATVASGAFPTEIARRTHGITVVQQACPQLAGAIEDGWPDEHLADLIQAYVASLLIRCEGRTLDTAVLGCTHYPLVAKHFRRFLPADTELLSQPDLAAASLEDYLRRHPEFAVPSGESRYVTSGDPVKVSAIASRFLGEQIRFSGGLVFPS
jgi:glutamate racemase